MTGSMVETRLVFMDKQGEKNTHFVTHETQSTEPDTTVDK
jgi:hypothetical protein